MATELLNEVVTIPLLLLAIFVAVSNITVCVLVYAIQKMRTYTNGVVVSLAVSDILIGGVLLPAFVTLNNSLMIQEYLCSVALLSGVFNICAVTYDRYVAVMHPLRYNILMRKRFPIVIAVTWSIAVGISLLPLLWGTDSNKVIHKVYVFCVEIGCVLVPHMFIFAGHFKIFKEVRRFVQRERRLTTSFGKKNKQFRVTSDMKVAKVFIVIAVTFALSWLPVEYMTTVYHIGRPDLIPTSLPIISLFTIALGSLVNPVVYSFMKPDFRRALKKILVRRRSIPFGNSKGWSLRRTATEKAATTAA